MPDSHEVKRPYPGLRPFESWEGEIFFGREEHTNRLLDILKERHFLAVIGPSGSGKSSLVRAGLLPTLPLGSIGTGSDWRVALMRPGNRPIRSLAHALLARSTLGTELVGEERIPQGGRDMTPDTALIESDLRRGPLGLIDIVQDARIRHTGKEDFNLLVLVDQFEELFTYADAGERQADEAEAFVNLLLATHNVPNTQIYIVLTMRTDFLGNCVRFLELPDAINRAQYLTPRLTREQIERAITSPAYLFNGDVEPTLVTELINTVSNDPDQLPILQHALSRMWDEASQRQSQSPCITWDDFKAAGGLTDALSLHADEILALLSPRNRIENPLYPGQLATADLFRAITEQRSAETGGQAVRRPQSLTRIADWSGRQWQDFIPVINIYAKEGVNFLQVNSPLNGDAIVDISHEALIRQWRRLREWVAQEARLASEYKRFRGLAEDYKNGSGALLTGAALARALEWKNGAFSRTPYNDAWKPTANWACRYRKHGDSRSDNEFNGVLKFINDSHAVVLKAKRRARFLNWVLIALTGLSVLFAFQSHNKQISLEASSLWIPLDFSAPVINVTKKQEKGLHKLEKANDARKQVFFDQLMNDPALAERFSNNPEAIMTAMVGISPTRKNELLYSLEKSPLQQNSDIFQLTRLLMLSKLEADFSIDGILSAIALKDKDDEDVISPKTLGPLIKSLVGNMAEKDLPVLSSRILASFNDPPGGYDFEPRAEGLAAIIARMPQAELSNMANQLIAAVKITTDPDKLDILQQSLANVTVKIQDEQQAVALANQLFNALTASSDPGQIDSFGKSLEKLATKIPDTLAGDLAGQLIILIKDSRYTYRSFNTLRQCLASVDSKLPDGRRYGETAKQLFTAMQESMVPEQFDALGQGLAGIAAKIPAPELDIMTIQLINAIKDPSQFKIIGQGLQENDFNRFRTIAKILAAMIQPIPEKQAGTLAETLFSAIKKQPQDPGQYHALGRGLKEAAAKMEQPEADTFANKLFITMNDTKNSRQFSALAEGVTELAKKMSAPKALELADQYITAISKLEKRQNYIRFDVLGNGLAQLAQKIPKEQAGALTEKLIKAVRISENRMQTMAFGSGMAVTAANIPALEIAQKAAFLISLFKESNDTQVKVFAKALVAMAKNMPEDQSLAVAVPLIAEINGLVRESKDEYRTKITALGKGLMALTAKVPEIQADELTLRLIAAINASNDPDKNEALGQGLAGMSAKITPAGAIAFAYKLISAMKESISPAHFKALGQGLTAVVEKLPQTRRPLAKQLVEIILQTQNHNQLQVQNQVLTVITGELKPSEKMLAQWFELLKDPLAPRTILTAAIRQRLSDIPQQNEGFWDLIEWAKQHYPDIDLEAPPKEPAVL